MPYCNIFRTDKEPPLPPQKKILNGDCFCAQDLEDEYSEYAEMEGSGLADQAEEEGETKVFI